MELTYHILRAAYDLLAETDPFVGWNLPDGEDVAFVVTRTPHRRGRCIAQGDKITIEISSLAHTYLPAVLSTMAHEMIHIHQYLSGLKPTHGKVFHGFVAEVCAVHGFDPGQLC